MESRRKIIEQLFRNMYAMRHKLMVGYTAKEQVIITPSQAFVLRLVGEQKSVSVKDVSQALNITSSAATQLIDGLAEKGYLVRMESADDRRVVSLALSEKAKKLFKEFKEQGLEKMIELFSALTDEELQDYAALNQKIADYIDAKKE